jgi:hypothetical protein
MEVDTLLSRYMEAGASVGTGILLNEHVRNIEFVKTKCLEYRNGDNGRGKTDDLGSWRRGGGGHNRFKTEIFGKQSKNGPAAPAPAQIVVPIAVPATPVSNTKGSWSAAVTKPPVQTPIQTGKYVPPTVQKAAGFHKSKEEVESKILNNLILSKLNKFTKENYDSIKDFLSQILNNDETEFLKDFMILVFKKATYERIYCPLYAKLITELSNEYPIIKAELMSLYNTYLKEFEKVEEEDTDNYDDFCELQKEKLYRLGYGQFLAELTRQGILDKDALMKMYNTILNMISSCDHKHKNQVEQMAACLYSMTLAFKGEKNPALISIRNGIAESCKGVMNELIQKAKDGKITGLTNKARFSLMDCVDILNES